MLPWLLIPLTQRYASETIRIYLAAAKAFGRWLSRHQLGIDDVSESVLQRYVANLKRLQKHPLTPYGRRPRLRTSFSGRQHLTALERDGMVIKGETQSSGGRPEQLFGLTTAGHELFPRHYSWFAELLISSLREEQGTEALRERLEGMGKAAGRQVATRLAGAKDRAERIRVLSEIMRELK